MTPSDEVSAKIKTSVENGAENTQLVVRIVENPAPKTSLGFVSECFEVRAPKGMAFADLTIPVNINRAKSLSLDMTSLKLFVLDEKLKIFCPVFPSHYEFQDHTVTGEIDREGIYTVIGASQNPWITATVEILRLLAPLNKFPELSDILVKRICNLILCRDNALKNAFMMVEKSADVRLPALPLAMADDPCDVCDVLQRAQGYLAELALPQRIPHFVLDDWLRDHPQIANSIVWRRGTRLPSGAANAVEEISYPEWASTQKAELAQMVDQIRDGNWPELPDAPPTVGLELSTPDDYDSILRFPYYSHETAWQYFLAHVAQSLYIEMERQVPWTITDYRPHALYTLFHSRSMFDTNLMNTDRFLNTAGTPPENLKDIVHVISPYLHGDATPGDPVRVYGWLRQHNVVGSKPFETIVRLLEWCRYNLWHYVYGRTLNNLVAHWQYAGLAPVERTLAGTVSTATQMGGVGRQHWTAGCSGTTQFLAHILRTVNIPVRFTRVNHSRPFFVRERLALAHGDDPYASTWRNDRSIPTESLFISEDKFNDWFGPDVDPEKAVVNTSRRNAEIWIEYLPLSALSTHCDDVASSRSPSNSRVASFLTYHPDITFDELEAMDLWGRMDRKIESLGGCVAVRRLYQPQLFP